MPDVPIDEDDPFIILFTSGTTGRPKGATLSHRNLIHFGTASACGRATLAMAEGGPTTAPAPPVAICGSPFFHISGTAPLLVTSARFGTTLVFPPAGRWDPLTHLELTEQYRVTTWSGVPTQYWRMLEHPDFERFDLSSVAGISSGGAPFPPELMRILNDRIPTAGLSNGYGMTESMGAGTLMFGRRYLTHRDSVGSPWPGIEVQIRDEDDNVLGEGEVGEICLRGAIIFLGYWDNPEATAEVLDDDRWYRTGDFGRIEDDVLYLESRMRDLILRGGENIYPMEIEHRLVEHPDIADAAVIGVDHRELGQEVKAFVVREGAELTAADVQAVGRGRAGAVQGAGLRRVPRLAAVHRDRQGHEARARTRGRDDMIIVVAALKGGVGKTTAAVHLAALAAMAKRATTLVDADPQASAADWLDTSPDPRFEGIEVVEAPTERLLTKALDAIGDDDVAVVDTPPGNERLLGKALERASVVVVPTRVGGVEIARVDAVLDLVGENLAAGLVISSARTYTRDYQEYLANWAEAGVPVWGSVPERVSIAAGPSAWLSWDGLEAYRAVWRHVLRAGS